MAHTFTHLLTHIIFSTKDRRPLLDMELKSRLFPYLGGIIRAHDGKTIIINGPTDHVQHSGIARGKTFVVRFDA